MASRASRKRPGKPRRKSRRPAAPPAAPAAEPAKTPRKSRRRKPARRISRSELKQLQAEHIDELAAKNRVIDEMASNVAALTATRDRLDAAYSRGISETLRLRRVVISQAIALADLRGSLSYRDEGLTHGGAEAAS